MGKNIQEEYSDIIQRNGAINFIGSSNRDQFNEMGQEHFDYLLTEDLQPHHVFLDVGCGALRTGQYIIPYLKTNHYFGLDRMPELIEFGLNDVLAQETVFEKDPAFMVNENFNCDFGNKPVNYVWCQSLMSHLNTEDIKLCLKTLKTKLAPDGKIYFTYFQQDNLSREDSDQQSSHSKKDLKYSSDIMDNIVSECGLVKEFNGTIGHPRGQWMYICKL